MKAAAAQDVRVPNPSTRRRLMTGTLARIARYTLVTCLGLLPLNANADSAYTVTATVSTLRTTKGALVCRLFVGPDGFPARGYRSVQTVAATGQTAQCVFPSLAAGTYALAVFHDENGNGKLDTNFLGLPAEGVGTSNNRRPLIGPPTWDGSKFAVAGNVALNITLRY